MALLDIGSESATKIKEPFTKEEVFAVLSELNGDKAPGPNGFSMAFWQFSMDFLRNDVMGFFREFYEHKKFIRNMNTTFLVLIPKKGDAKDLKDFRPISLVGGLYKLLAKVLANRLKRIIGKVIFPAQNAFVEGRQILDATLIANEGVGSWLRRNESGLLCKLDIAKAYDHINWDFILMVLKKIDFRSRWLQWMK